MIPGCAIKLTNNATTDGRRDIDGSLLNLHPRMVMVVVQERQPLQAARVAPAVSLGGREGVLTAPVLRGTKVLGPKDKRKIIWSGQKSSFLTKYLYTLTKAFGQPCIHHLR